VSGSSARRTDVEDLVAAYRADLVAAGMFAEHPVTSVARMFFTRIGVDGWTRLSLAEQCALPLKDRRVVGWLIVTGRVRPCSDYLVACRPYLGEVAAHHHRGFYERFRAMSAQLGFDRIVTRLQWSALAKVAALSGATPEQLTAATIRAGRAGGGDRPAPTRQPRGESAQRCPVRRADHFVSSRSARRPAP